ncbi:3-phosphoshikimate 1-carboxyvinyltransferase [mine drainage metagenome]|uniref:3-phosphoshikimate 1-carboxyvinyltransferase n=1 Tax=mine drainage metagenome TaxID=410659 RepID=A0A1J5PKZ9_9ZZZZ
MGKEEHWSAPRAHGAINAALKIPGSKSVTNRALILAALADGTSHLHRPLRSRDTLLMAAGLRSLGVKVEDADSGWQITPGQLRGPAQVDVGNAGTVMRFLPPVAALAHGSIRFDGDPRSHERPIGPMLSGLRAIGANIIDDGRNAMPITIEGTGSLRGGEVSIDASASSQFVSALLLVAPATEKGITVHHIGSSLPSMPHIEMTVAMLRQFGASVDDSEPNRWRVENGRLSPQNMVIEPDLSNAAPFLAAAIITDGSVTIEDWPTSTTQPGDQLRHLLAMMGARVEFVAEGLRVSSGESLVGIDVDLHDVGELTPMIAALCAFATTDSHLRGIGHLRLHETDRLTALATEINRLGGDVIEHPDSLEIHPRPLHGGVFHTYEDHRLATAGALIGLVVPGVEVENIETTKKTLPDFVGLWSKMIEA